MRGVDSSGAPQHKRHQLTVLVRSRADSYNMVSLLSPMHPQVCKTGSVGRGRRRRSRATGQAAPPSNNRMPWGQRLPQPRVPPSEVPMPPTQLKDSESVHMLTSVEGTTSTRVVGPPPPARTNQRRRMLRIKQQQLGRLYSRQQGRHRCRHRTATAHR